MTNSDPRIRLSSGHEGHVERGQRLALQDGALRDNNQILVHCQYGVNDRYLDAGPAESAAAFVGGGWVTPVREGATFELVELGHRGRAPWR